MHNDLTVTDRDGAYTVVSVERGAPTGSEPFYVLIKAYPPEPPIGRSDED